MTVAEYLDLSSLHGTRPVTVNSLDALGEIRRGIHATSSDENSALLWLYIGILLAHRFPDTARPIAETLRRTALDGSVEALDMATVGIARAGHDPRAG